MKKKQSTKNELLNYMRFAFIISWFTIEVISFQISVKTNTRHTLYDLLSERRIKGIKEEFKSKKRMGNWLFQTDSPLTNTEQNQEQTPDPDPELVETSTAPKRSKRRWVQKKKTLPPAFFDLIQCLKHKDVVGGLAAYQQLKEFIDKGGDFRIPEHAYNGILNLCGSTKYVDQGKEIFEEMIKVGYKPQENSYKFMIDECCSRGYSCGAMLHIDKMIESGLTPRLRSYAPILKYLSQSFKAEEILEVWDHMRSHNVTAKEEQYLQLIDCFGGAGVLFEDWYLDWVELLLMSLKEEVFGLTQESCDILNNRFSASAIASTQISTPAATVVPLETGVCPECEGQLQAVGLQDQEKHQVREALLQMAGEQEPIQTEYLHIFASWLKERQPYTVVIDAANVAYADQNIEGGSFSHFQINMIAKHLESKGERVLIVIPERYMRDRVPNTTRYRKQKKVSVSDEALEIMAEWKEKGDIYIVSDGANDDWYWMYSTVAFNKFPSMVVSNDKMRDHRLSLLAPRPFYRWKNTQIINYKFLWPEDEVRTNENIEVACISPPVFSREIQCTSNGVWHFPINNSLSADNHDCNQEWLCVHTKLQQEKR